jgi:hypothetical protein
MFEKSRIIKFSRIGAPRIGYISVLENDINIPFKIKRVFYTYYTPQSIIRGKHANKKTIELLIALSGKIVVTTETPTGKPMKHVLDTPNKGLYIPPYNWTTMKYSHTAVQLVLTSTLYDEKYYIRDYNIFKKTRSK